MTQRVVIGAAVARRPSIGGHTWVALQWLLGFRSLGWEALLLDWLEPELCTDASGQPTDAGHAAAIGYLADAMQLVGLDDAWAVAIPGHRPVGPARRALLEANASCDLMINVMGYLPIGLGPRATMRVFLDIDPGFGQMWRELGLADVFTGHDRFVTLATNVGGESSRLPTAGLEWLSTLPPVALEQWPFAPGGDGVTSVVSWRGPFDAINFQGTRYGLRVHEFRKFIELPDLAGVRPQIALDIGAADRADRDRLLASGWELADPRAVAGEPSSYRDFVRGSAVELGIAKEMYVATRGGWFSDRSACYLASGKPVVAHDTGFGGVMPTGDGVIPFACPEDAAMALAEALGKRKRHSRAARQLAEEHLAADRVVGRLLDQLGVA